MRQNSKKFAVLSVIALTIPLLSSCYATQRTQWTHPELESGQWGVDAAQCKWEAKRKAKRDYEKDAKAQQSTSFSDDEQSIDAMFASTDIDKAAQSLFDRCMEDLGYQAITE